MPFLKKDQGHRILLLFAGLCIVLLGVMIFAVPPGTDPDPCWGFMIMNSMEHGGHFNLLVSPAFQDIAKDRYEFLAWWSPGQYLLPYFFKLLFKVTTGQAVSLTIAICSLLGLAGFYRLFKQLGFTKWIAAISTAFIATQLFFVLPFTYFTGGEVLIFAFMGWFLYGCFSFKKITWQVLVFLFFSGLIGFFSKSSFLWMYAAGVACMWINISMDETNNISLSRYSKKEIITFLKNGLLLAVPFIGAVAIIYIFYLSKGITPTSDQGALLVKPETFGYPLASPMLSAFSVDELFDGLIYRPDGSTGITYHSALLLVFVLAFCSLAFMVVINRFSPTKKYLRAIYVFYIIGVIFFSYMYLKQATISYESRHFRIIGLLCLPGFIYLLFKTKVTKAIFFIAWIYFAYMSFNFFRINYKGNKGAAKGNTGLSQVIYDKATLNEIVRIDREHHNAVFVVMSSDIGAEIYNNRVITMEDDMPDDFFATLKYRGKAGPLYILMPARYLKNGRESNIIKAFTDYHNFASRQLGPDYYLYYAVD